jgi:hypothetical protein
MADLSHLLGAVYGDDQHDPDGPSVPVEPPAAERPPEPPEWADDAHLDAAFAGWTPGPPDEAPAAERAVLSGAGSEPPPPLADDLAAALSEALVPKREAAAELTATTADTAHPDPVPVKEQEPEAVPQPAPVEKAVLLPTPVEPAVHVARQWDRSDDDILPERKAKGLRLSLSLRRG